MQLMVLTIRRRWEVSVLHKIAKTWLHFSKEEEGGGGGAIIISGEIKTEWQRLRYEIRSFFGKFRNS